MDIFQNAKWIWHGQEPKWNESALFETRFQVEKAVECSSVLYISVNSHYAVYVNDRFVSCDQFPDYPDWKSYDALPINDYLVEGSNTLRIQAYWQGCPSLTYRPFEPALIFSLWNGSVSILNSDERTLSCRDARYALATEKISSQLAYSFRYDSTIAACELLPSVEVQAEWTGKRENLHLRPNKKMEISEKLPCIVKVAGQFEDPLQSDAAKRMHRMTEDLACPEEGPTGADHLAQSKIVTSALLSPISLPCEKGVQLCQSVLLLDLGREETGFFELDIDVPVEGDILIGWGEHLEDLRLRTKIGYRNFAAVYRAHKGRNHFFYPIKRMGLRYLQLHLYTASVSIADANSLSNPSANPSANPYVNESANSSANPADFNANSLVPYTLYYAGIRPSHYPLSTVVNFHCADHLHEQIYKTSLWTLMNCMHAHYEDCPWREQALYSMDSRNQMLCGYYSFEEYSFAKASLRMIGRSLRPDHMLELTSPGQATITIPSFTAIFLIELGEYGIYSGDTDFIREMYPYAQDIAQAFLNSRQANGMAPRMHGKEYWNFYEWADGLSDGGHLDCLAEDTPDQACYDAPMQFFILLGLRQMANMARMLGRVEEAQCYEQEIALWGRQAEAFFWNPERNLYSTYRDGDGLRHEAELTQALALCAGVVPEEKAAALRCLLSQEDNGLVQVTLSHSIFKYEALMQDPKQYARLVFNRIAGIFGAMLYQNATTFWETSDGAAAFSNAGSLCHGWSAIPVYFYLRYVCDTKNENTRLSPDVTGIYEAKAGL